MKLAKTQAAIVAKYDPWYGYPVYLHGQRVGDLTRTAYGWGSSKKLPTQQWTFESRGNVVGAALRRAMGPNHGYSYKREIMAALEAAATEIQTAQPGAPA